MQFDKYLEIKMNTQAEHPAFMHGSQAAQEKPDILARIERVSIFLYQVLTQVWGSYANSVQT
jgi:hypothetical protein